MDLHIENLEEWIHDDKRTISYKFLSINLGININHAKQLLYKFYENNKDKIEATYLISGYAADNNFTDRIPKYSFVSEDLSDNISGSYFILLCSQDDLEETKKKFSKIFSIHLYSLAPTKAPSYDVFYSNLHTEENKKAFEDKSILSFGGIKSQSGMEIKSKRADPVIHEVTKKDEQTITKPQNSDEFAFAKKENSVGSNSNKSKSKSSASDNKKGNDRIKNMFASAASKPPKEKPIVAISSEESEEEVKEIIRKKEVKKVPQSKAKKPNAKKSASKKVEPDKKKRRRIKDILSSDSEEESKHSDSDNDSVPDSPKRKKRHMLTSESEEEAVPPSPPRELTPKKKELPPRNKNMVVKEVLKTYKDEDGWDVTVREIVRVDAPMETDEIEDSPEKVTEKKEIPKETPMPSKTKAPSKNSSDKNDKEMKDAEKKEPEKKVSKVKVPPKGQPTLMSFFKKK